MNKQQVICAPILIGIFILGCSSGAHNQPNSKMAVSESGVQMTDKKSNLADFRQLYRAAKNEQERRSVCLDAIDKGLIYRIGPVSAVDEIFGTQLASSLPTKKEDLRTATIDFVPIEVRASNSVGASRTGWFLSVAYDFNGEIQNYYLTNLHK